jgi:hypothetical protein
LIACGRVSKLAPVIARTKAAETAIAEGAIGILQAIGARRLVELSGDADETIRRPAAEALCLVFRVKPTEQVIAELSERVPQNVKIDRVNKLCRAWPRAAGTFIVRMGGREAPMPATVEQIGRTFYLQIGTGVFASDVAPDRHFTIPIDRWCAATGVAVDAREVRNWVTGRITLASPYGSGWEGEASITARRKLSRPPPGFLPVESLEQDASVTLPVLLENR